MKKSIQILCIATILWGCNFDKDTDNFYQTERYFIMDKSTYKIGEEFELTVVIAPKKERKQIRFYDNYKNLRISFSLINDERNIYNGSWIKQSNEFLRDTTATKFLITKEEPFKKVLKVKISETIKEVMLEIPELNFKEGLPKEDFDENTKVRIHGHCYPINPEIAASLEEFVATKDIKITLE